MNNKENKYLNEVYPNKGESKKDFISRFMEVTKDEYPDVKQRYAVANSYWDRRNKVNEEEHKMISEFLEELNKIDESSSGYVETYNGCKIHDMGDVFVITDKKGLNIHETKNDPKAWIDDHTEGGLLKEKIDESAEMHNGYKIEDAVYLHGEDKSGAKVAISKDGIIVGGADSFEEAKNKIDNMSSEEDLIYKEDMTEDTIKTSSGKWTNKGKEGTHGTFKTKKEADQQRKAMFSNKKKGAKWGESLKEEYGPHKGSYILEEIARDVELGNTVGNITYIDENDNEKEIGWTLYLTINGEEIEDLNLSTVTEDYFLDYCSYPIKDGFDNYYDVEATFDKTSGIPEEDLRLIGFDRNDIIKYGQGEDVTTYFTFRIEFDDEDFELDESFNESIKKRYALTDDTDEVIQIVNSKKEAFDWVKENPRIKFIEVVDYISDQDGEDYDWDSAEVVWERDDIDEEFYADPDDGEPFEAVSKATGEVFHIKPIFKRDKLATLVSESDEEVKVPLYDLYDLYDVYDWERNKLCGELDESKKLNESHSIIDKVNSFRKKYPKAVWFDNGKEVIIRETKENKRRLEEFDLLDYAMYDEYNNYDVYVIDYSTEYDTLSAKNEEMNEGVNDKYIGKKFDDEFVKHLEEIGFVEDVDDRQIGVDRFTFSDDENEKVDIYTYWKGKNNSVSVYVKDGVIVDIGGRIDESITEAKQEFVKVGPSLPRNWVIVRHNGKYSLLSEKEFEKAKSDPDKWFKETFVDEFTTKKELIKQFKREPAYSSIFDGIEINESVDEREVLSKIGSYEIIKDGYGFGIDDGTTVNRFFVDNDGVPHFDYEPTNKMVRKAIDKLVNSGKLDNPHYKGNDANYVGNTLKYGRGIKEDYSVKYITKEIFDKTNSKLLKDEIDRDNVSVVVKDGRTWWTERNRLSSKADDILRREIKRLYPELISLSEISVKEDIAFIADEDQFKEINRICKKIGIEKVADINHFKKEMGCENCSTEKLIELLREYEKELGDDFKIEECNLKESKEIDRKGFVSLVKLGEKPYDGYSILNDGYFVERIYAESDEDAIKQFRDRTAKKVSECKGSINIRESLNDIDNSNYNQYDLRNLYDSQILSEDRKVELAKLLHENKDAKEIYKFLAEGLNDEEEEETVEETVEKVEEDRGNAFFIRKPTSLEEIKKVKEERIAIDPDSIGDDYSVIKVVESENIQSLGALNSIAEKYATLFDEIGDNYYNHYVIKVRTPEGDWLIDTNGYDYARYVAFVEKE